MKEKSVFNFVSQYDMLCNELNLGNKHIFMILSAILIISFLVSGILSDKYGRKRIIIVKGILLLIIMAVFIIIGFAASL